MRVTEYLKLNKIQIPYFKGIKVNRDSYVIFYMILINESSIWKMGLLPIREGD